jgi:hypothetical protein
MPETGLLIDRLGRAGIECQGGYYPLHLRVAGPKPKLPRTEGLFGRVICIPVERRAAADRVRAALSDLRREPNRALLLPKTQGRAMLTCPAE